MVIELTTICTIMQIIIEMRSRRLLLAKHERRNHIIPVLDIMAAATAIKISCIHVNFNNRGKHTTWLRSKIISQSLHFLFWREVVKVSSQAPVITAYNQISISPWRRLDKQPMLYQSHMQDIHGISKEEENIFESPYSAWR